MLLEGIHLPITTPFYPDGRLNLRKLEQNVERYSRTPVAGLLVLGTSGEGSSLTDAEAGSVLTAAIGAAASHKVMLANVGRNSVSATLELAAVAAEVEYDAVAVAAPALSLSRLETLTYFQAVADRSLLPVVMLSEAGRELTVEMIAELAGHPAILGVIDHAAVGDRLAAMVEATREVSREVTVTTVFAAATGRMLKPQTTGGSFVSAESLGGGTAVVAAPAAPALKTRTKRVGFQILGGSTAGMLDALTSGAVGAVPRFGACAPQACYEVFQAWKDDDLPLSAEKQERLRAVAAVMEGTEGIAAIKFGCDLNAYFGGLPRLPLLGPTGSERTRIEQLMAALHN
ncbi:dihydrodipicolinate synthase family protein [Granulicella sp. WH15]|uniref:dihydrodipicolinate synthase family protein n=1 Tax=Granulicella sp. WH15 TaxID=2602070 RepID=UPI0013678E45|nr:dihydrodipicolinate synthase family protein [Granulicella sp. WH15]QHN04015.1 dihydrodipicolinate synthase family protein [Granulicella sp. WH15]